MKNVFLENQKLLLNAAMKGEENQKYKGGKFITNIADSDYDYIRGMYGSIGMKSFHKFIGE